MKKSISRIVAAFVAAIVILGCPASTYAAERSYTYNYDYWGDVQDSPDLYTVSKVFTSSDLNLEVKLKNPQGLYINGDRIYVCDTDNDRIVELSRPTAETLKFEREITSFKGNAEIKTFSKPTDMAISEDGNFFIADKGNSRIVKLDKDLNYLMEFVKPVENTLDPEMVFQPNKIVVDTAERVYCIAIGVNKGLIKYEADGFFSGFIGATPATYDFKQYIYKKFATQEQLAKMESFVPTEYDNIYIDKEGFIYACTGSVDRDDLRAGKAQAIRKLNLLGSNILVTNGVYYDGDFPVYGDLYMGSGGGFTGPSYFADVTTFDNDVYVCLDRNRGRLFCYDDQGKMIYICGGPGNMDGYFNRAISIDHMDYDLFVLDQNDCAITMFRPTSFGNLVFEAMDLFDDGEYDASQAAWEEVIRQNGNYDLAYIGIGRSYLRQEDYKTALEYFELKYDDENWSKAYRQYRKIAVEENIVTIIIVLLILFFVPMTIGKVKSIKREFETADIFKV